MNTFSRRQFVQNTGMAAAAVAAPAIVRAAAESDKINLAFIGPGGMGTNHVKTMCQRKDVIFSWVCDADSKRAEAAAATIQQMTGQTPKVARDMRKVFDDPAVQAVIMATPDHWHAPGAILAANSGKHVYVEKPCSHNLREGRLMIEAAHKNKVVMQVGTQSRSTAHIMQAIEKLRSGMIGEVLVAKAWNSQLRANQGRKPNTAPPPNLDYELWLGPVPEVPFKETYHPAHWRWFHHFGAGDFGNDGVHDIDIANWGLGVEQHPNRIIGQGSKLFFDDDQEWPDTLYCGFEYDLPDGKKKQLIYEQRIWSPYVQEGHENGCAWYGTEGMIVGGKKSGWQIFGKRNKLIEEIKGASGPDLAAHHDNFLTCIRSGAKPHADIEINHRSTSLCHLGNIASRTRSALVFDPAKEQFIGGNEAAAALLKREYRDHWAKPGV
ncbi:MAG: Gfo/Idh/MocA family oxidoreductase [Prosthecobacter sp.]|nr:Gfo/Idh/MocA family oxidoreductase [Prosthecobacter sp.]